MLKDIFENLNIYLARNSTFGPSRTPRSLRGALKQQIPKADRNSTQISPDIETFFTTL